MAAAPQAFFGNLVLFAFVFDALVSLFAAVTGWPLPAVPLGLFHFFVVWSCLGALLIACVSTRFPLSVFLPVLVTTLAARVHAARVLTVDASPSELMGMAVLQGIVAVLVLVQVRLVTGRRWSFAEEDFDGSRFSWTRFVPSTLVGLLLVGLFVPAWLVAWGMSATESAMQGFLRFERDGIYLEDRTYERGSHTIRLIAMAHVGEDAAYRRVFADLERAGSDTIVLTEGLTDEDGLFDVPLDYGRLADALGVDTQREIEDYVPDADPYDADDGPDYVHADVDMRDFGDVTVEWLTSVAEIYASTDPLSAFAAFYVASIEDPMAGRIAMTDILEYRNKVVLDEIGRALPRYRQIVVPWGALHMPGISTVVEAQGFEATRARYVRLISWRRLVGAAASAVYESEPAS